MTHGACETFVVALDGRVVGHGWAALMSHVIAQGRALPLAWRVRQGPTGHVPEALHIALVALMSAGIPTGTQVVLLGDGAFEGTALQETRSEAGWCSAYRTAMSTKAMWEGATLRRDT